jgi:hypothetical protein
LSFICNKIFVCDIAFQLLLWKTHQVKGEELRIDKMNYTADLKESQTKEWGYS